MRLTLVIGSLGPGGAERVLTTLANLWTVRGEHVTLITISSTATDFFPLHPNITRVGLDLLDANPAAAGNPFRALASNYRRITHLRRAIRNSRPDCVISFVDGVNVMTLAATRRMHTPAGKPLPVIVSERVDPRYWSPGRAWSALRRFLYPRASAIVVQTESVRPWAQHFVPAPRVHVIPNPVSPPAASKSTMSTSSTEFIPSTPTTAPPPIILAMGRLAPQKGFDTLLRAFAQIAPDHPDWSLRIFGEGPERANLTQLATELNLTTRVEFPGHTQSPADEFRRASFFVLSSRFEGFPNALTEAMAAGLPAISTDCPSGPADIIRPETDGLLVPVDNIPALASAMRRLITNPDLRHRLAKNVPEITDRLSPERILSLWDSVIQSVL